MTFIRPEAVYHFTCFINKTLCDNVEVRCTSVVRAFAHLSFLVVPLNFFSFQPVPHDWCNKGYSMCYPVCGVMHVKEPLQSPEVVYHFTCFINKTLYVIMQSPNHENIIFLLH